MSGRLRRLVKRSRSKPSEQSPGANGSASGPRCGLCGVAVANVFIVVCVDCGSGYRSRQRLVSAAASQSSPAPPTEPPAAEIAASTEDEPAVITGSPGPLPPLAKTRHKFVDDPHPPMPGTKYRCSECGERYAIHVGNHSCQIAWMHHIAAAARSTGWDPDRHDDARLDRALKGVYRWRKPQRMWLIQQYRKWLVFKSETAAVASVES